MIANLKVGKTIKALANLTTPQTTQTTQTPQTTQTTQTTWGVSPQAKACSLTTKN